MDEAAERARLGVAYGLGAYLIWGFLPLYFKLLQSVLPDEIVAQRILWSLLLMAVLIVVGRRTGALRAALGNGRAMLILSGSAVLIAANWLIYVWAVNSDHVLETSLGYFLNPLLNVLLGVVLLKERLRPAQTFAVLIAAAGVAVLALSAEGGLWISLALAVTFGFYGLLRKIAPVESVEGLTIETLLLAPIALGWLIWLASGDRLGFGDEAGVSALLAFGGVATAVPLLLFAAAARRLRYATIGVLQYLAPTIQFLLAIFAFGEPLSTPHLVCFAAIWTGLALYAADGLRSSRRPIVVPAE